MMRLTNLAEKFESLPLDELSGSAFEQSLVEEIGRKMRSRHGVPHHGQRINFNDDAWKFDELRVRVNFATGYEGLTLNLKLFFIFSLLVRRVEVSTADKDNTLLRGILEAMCDKYGHTSECFITQSEFDEFIGGRKYSVSYRQGIVSTVRKYVLFLKAGSELGCALDENKLYEDGKILLSRLNKDNRKTPDAPENVFRELIGRLKDVLVSPLYSATERVTAAAILIQSQTGFRTGDLLNLRFDSLKVRHTMDRDLKEHFFVYVPQKTDSTVKNVREYHIPCNALALQAYNMLKALQPAKCASDYLISSKLYGHDPMVHPSILNLRYIKLYDKIMPEHLLSLEDDRLTRVKVPNYSKNRPDRYISIISTKQFRVHYCTELYNRGVPQELVEYALGHVSGMMAGYYYRAERDQQVRTESFIRETLLNKSRLLGGNNAGGFMEALRQKAAALNPEVCEDMRAILRSIGKMYSIRAKRGGVCIKPINTSCADEKPSQALLCAKNVCSNLYHFYFMIDDTLADIESSWAIISDGLAKGRINKLTMEANNLKYILNKRLKPEFEELLVEIERRGAEEVCRLHPNLNDVLPRIDEIRGSIGTWEKFLTDLPNLVKKVQIKFRPTF